MPVSQRLPQTVVRIPRMRNLSSRDFCNNAKTIYGYIKNILVTIHCKPSCVFVIHTIRKITVPSKNIAEDFLGLIWQGPGP